MQPIKYFLYFTIITLCYATSAQNKKNYRIHTVAFYNLENLFDTINDPNTLDEYSPIMELKSNKSEVYWQKIHNIAQAISQIGVEATQNTPALLGVAEVENETVLNDLVNHPLLQASHYDIIHFNAPDIRGIDVGLLYQKKLFKPSKKSTHQVILYDDDTKKRIYTRDQLLVSGYLDSELIHIIVNHWPSRRGGETASQPRRIAAAKVTRSIIDSLQIIDPYAKIIVMGDFNDNPSNTSIRKVLQAQSKKTELALKGIYNPYFHLFKNGLGTTAYQDAWSLFDQILLSKPFLENNYEGYQFYKAGIFNKQFLIEQIGKYKGYPKRSYSNGAFNNGFSDHFPVFVYVIKSVSP